MDKIYIIAPIIFIVVIVVVVMMSSKKKIGSQGGDYTRKVNEALETGGLIMVMGTEVELNGELVPEDDKIVMQVSKYVPTDLSAYFGIPEGKTLISASYAFSNKNLKGDTVIYSTQEKVSLEFTAVKGMQYAIKMVDKIPTKEKVIAQSDVSTDKFIKAFDKKLFIVCIENPTY